jgi:hypothetical protein
MKDTDHLPQAPGPRPQAPGPLWDPPPPPYEAQADASAEQRRLGRQCLAILARLEAAGEAGVTNAELAEISIKYTGRISDLRAAGHQIECYDQDRQTGLSKYRLVGGPNKQEATTDNTDGHG